jgi:multidrug transporter EmrE-like cation transporter
MTVTPVSSMLWVLLASIIGSFGSVLLKSGSERLRHGLKHLFFNERLIAGIVLFLLSSYFFVLGVRKGELSVLYPMVSLGYIWTLLWSRIFFGEPFTRAKLAGLCMIVVGVFFIGLGGR